MQAIVAVEKLKAFGHPNVKAFHATTLEITRDNDLTPRGDCILAVSATKSAFDLSKDLKDSLRRGDWLVMILAIPDTDLYDYMIARGSCSLTFTDRRSLVVRKSDYIDGRTIAVKSTKAAKDIKREIISMLRNPCVQLDVTLIAVSSQIELNDSIIRLLLAKFLQKSPSKP
ncbi:DUF371 domain-containing protein [Infirmifilum sp. NZ]|uniref:DUF371 domain-containing protein n=1 Tax=Infirmifilum sp. NZ TaxID=2926850 RepID=UPI0027A03F14|nr:DUF371 domain-containing protein [Infirmifilum sp. NZ]UNQ74254.1 DUF371 domain-containing protein [Infirmifilum sp. NZ]